MRDEASLDAALRALRPARDRAPIALLVQRLPGEGRACPPSVDLDVEKGVVGDRWSLSERPKLHSQVTLMRWDVATAMTDDPAALGDNLFAAIDTSEENLPAGTLLRVGTATCVVTDKPHTGCSKFQRRAGADALAITKRPDWLAARLRGIHLRVLESGVACVGDEIEVLARGD